MKKLFVLILSIIIFLVSESSANAQGSQKDAKPESKIPVSKTRIIAEREYIWHVTAGIMYESYGVRYINAKNINTFEMKENLLPTLGLYSERGEATLSYGLNNDEIRMQIFAPVLPSFYLYGVCSYFVPTRGKYIGFGMQKLVASIKSTQFNIFTEVGGHFYQIDFNECTDDFLSIGIRINIQDRIFQSRY